MDSRRCSCDDAQGWQIAPPGAQTRTYRPSLRSMFLGEDILAWLVLALGGALAVGNFLALVRPPAAARDEGDLRRAPVARTVIMGVVGLVAALWSLGSLIGG